MLTSEGIAYLQVMTTISSNEFLCLFGPSGAGKTTLIRILAGLTKPEKGKIVFGETIWFDSEKKINLPPQERNIGYMFQDYALFPNMTVEQNIRYGQKQTCEKKIEELLHHFDLTRLRKQKPSKLSGGQKQRVALARALASDPKILMLDEPLSALDYEMRVALQLEIAKAHQLLNTTTIMISHDIDEVMLLGSKVSVLKNGEIVNTGSPTDIFESNFPAYHRSKNHILKEESKTV